MKLQLDQSQCDVLQELGVNVNLATFYTYNTISKATIGHTFTISDIIQFIPKSVDGCGIEVYYRDATNWWEVGYPDLEGRIEFLGKELIDALFDFLVWLIESKYINPRELRKDLYQSISLGIEDNE